jgi:hypothetical protein
VGYNLACKHHNWLERLASDKHSGLLEIFINYGHNLFIKLGPVGDVIKLFRHIHVSVSVTSVKVTLKSSASFAPKKYNTLAAGFNTPIHGKNIPLS